MTSRTFFRGIFWTLIALLLVIHAFGGWAFSNDLIADGFTPDSEPVVLPFDGPDVVDVSYESDIGSFDAWYIPARGTTWVLHVHGIGTTPAEADFLFGPLHDAGYPQLSISYRNDIGQPEDPSGYYQYGVTEWADILGAMEYAKDNGADAIVFSGFGAGSSHILSFMYRHVFDDIKGVVLDSPNVNFGDTVDFTASQRDMPLIPTEMWPTVTWIAKFTTSLRIGVNWKSIDYIDDAVASLRIPVLVHHGTDDSSVPVTQSITFAETVPERVRLIQVPGAGHLGSYETAPEEYLAAILGFLGEVG